MIDLCIQKSISYVYTTVSDVSVSRIGDVVLLDNVENRLARDPWKKLFESDEVEIIGGSLSETLLEDIIRFKVKYIYDDSNIISTFKQKRINMAILQGEKDDDIILCSVTGNFCGYKINYNETVFDFSVNKSEMIRNR